jgi:membrane protein
MSKILEDILPKRGNFVVLVVTISSWVIAPIPVVGGLEIVQNQRKGIITLLHANGLIEILHQAFSNYLISGIVIFGIIASVTGFIAVPSYYIGGSNIAISLILCWTLSGFLKIPDGLVPWFVRALVIMPIFGVCFREIYSEESFLNRGRANLKNIKEDILYGICLKICIILGMVLYPFLYILALIFKGVPNSPVEEIVQYHLSTSNSSL